MFSQKQSVILNDDVLQLILCHLSVRQLFRLETTSEQFRRCVDYALKQKTGLRLGKKFQNMECLHEKHSTHGGSINRSAPIKCNQYDITIEVDKGLERFGSILRRCPNLKTLYLSECHLNEQVFQLIVDNCKNLECLTLCGNIISNRGYSHEIEDFKRMAQMIARINLKHLQVVGQYLYLKEANLNTSFTCITNFSYDINYLITS